MSPTIERHGPYTYLVIGADKFLLTLDDQMQIFNALVPTAEAVRKAGGYYKVTACEPLGIVLDPRC